MKGSKEAQATIIQKSTKINKFGDKPVIEPDDIHDSDYRQVKEWIE